MTVYVTQETDADFSGAEAWGPVKFLTKDDLTNNADSLVNRGIREEIEGKLRDFDEGTDWIVIAGSPYVSALVFMLLGWGACMRVRVLRWDNRDRVYRPCMIVV